MKGLIGYAIALFGISLGLPAQAQFYAADPSTPVLSALNRGASPFGQPSVVPSAMPNGVQPCAQSRA